MKHKVKIAVSNGGKKTQVLTSGSSRIPMRLLRWLLGDFCEILILTPGRRFRAWKYRKSPRGLTFPAMYERW